MLDHDGVIAKVKRLCQVGESLLNELDYDLYDQWNESTLKILDLIFGQSSEPFMSFRFPGGGEAADSRETRVKNSISQKLKVLSFVQKDLAGSDLKPKLGWAQSDSEIEKELSRLESQ